MTTFQSVSASSITNSKKAQSTVSPIEETGHIFEDISVLKALNKAKFPVYLIRSQVNKQNYAMKVFAYSSNKPHPYFKNEARFHFLDHQNVIKTQHVEHERETVSKGNSKKVSYTIMEYAPYGDFFDFVMNNSQEIDDKLIRTYFKQLIEGLEYLHKNGVSHMDLKLENLLMGKDYTLKIADFDLSYIANDPKILSKGTIYYRPPELLEGKCKNTQAVDIYSAGILLFAMMTRGMLPHAEDKKVAGIDFAALLYSFNEEFWAKHCEIQDKETSFFDKDFKDLFNSMVKLNPDERASISEIKKSKWYNGPCYTQEELITKVGKMYEF